MLPNTTTRVQNSTAAAINQRIAQETEERIRFYAANPHRIHQRLQELDEEWDMERTLETNASGLALVPAAARPARLVSAGAVLSPPRRQDRYRDRA